MLWHQAAAAPSATVQMTLKMLTQHCLSSVLSESLHLHSHSLELVLGHKHGDFGDVPPQLDASLQLAHLHLCLQSSRALHWTHQHQLTRHTVRTLDREVAPGLPAPQQGEAKGVPHWTQR